MFDSAERPPSGSLDSSYSLALSFRVRVLVTTRFVPILQRLGKNGRLISDALLTMLAPTNMNLLLIHCVADHPTQWQSSAHRSFDARAFRPTRA